jgi:hypothetical protein
MADTLGLWMLLGIAAGAMTGIAAIILGLNTGPIDEGILVGLLGVVLVFDLPVCLFLLWDWASSGKVPELPLGRLLWQLFPLADIYDERAFQHTLSAREDLTGDEFYQRYYQGTGVPQTVVLRLLAIYSKFFELSFTKLRPDDWPPAIAEFDMEPLVVEIEQEFGIPHSQWHNVNGSFDSVARYVTQILAETDCQKCNL